MPVGWRVVQDPQGAYFCVWQPKDNIGAGLVNGPGLMCWNELHTTDLAAAEGFYTGCSAGAWSRLTWVAASTT